MSSKKAARAAKAFRRVETTMRPLLELFAVCDDVFTEPDALSQQNVYKTGGRIYRQWIEARTALDPDFDPDRYRQEMKSSGTSAKELSPLGRPLPASGSRTRSTDRTSTSEKSQEKTAKREKPSASRSASTARSDAPASGGRSKKKNRTECGERSRTAKEKDSASGSRQRDTQRSPKDRR